MSGGYITGTYAAPSDLPRTDAGNISSSSSSKSGSASDGAMMDAAMGMEKQEIQEAIRGPVVVVCQDRLFSETEFKNVMMHELIHAFDDCRAHMDVTNCDHHACTEIRASKLSGECNFLEEVRRFNFSISGQYQVCDHVHD